MIKTVYQTDSDGVFLHETVANELALNPGAYNVPYGALENPPPITPDGKVARWDGKHWSLVKDYRRVTLWSIPSGNEYIIGSEIDIEGQSVRYAGWGELPSWLSETNPTQPASIGGRRQSNAFSAAESVKTINRAASEMVERENVKDTKGIKTAKQRTAKRAPKVSGR